jgi:hypothetical protein
VLGAIRYFQAADMETKVFASSFASYSGKAALETQETIKTAFGDNAMARTQMFKWFSRLKYQLTFFSVHDVPPQFAQGMTWNKPIKSSTKNDDTPIRRSLTGLTSHIECFSEF